MVLQHTAPGNQSAIQQGEEKETAADPLDKMKHSIRVAD